MTQPTAPADWPRRFYRPGGGTPFLFYVVYGSVKEPLSLPSDAYRCDSIPDGLELTSYGPGDHPEVVDRFRQGYLWDELVRVNPELAGAIAAQTRCIVVRGSVQDDTTLNFFRNTVGLLACMLEAGAVGLFDPQSFRWWSKAEWMTSVLGSAEPRPRQHVTILVSEEESGDGTRWYHTRGLRTFGRPDLSVHRVPPALGEAIVDLLNRFIEFEAFGGVIPDGEEIRMSSLPAGMRCHRGGDVDDPDFNNVHVEIRWADRA